jgi:hypothetical protein
MRGAIRQVYGRCLACKTPRLDPNHPRQGVAFAQGIEGAGPPQAAAVPAQGRRPCVGTEPPQSPVFCGSAAKNAPKSEK